MISNEFLQKFTTDYQIINNTLKKNNSSLRLVGSTNLLYKNFIKYKTIENENNYITDIDFSYFIQENFNNNTIYNFLKLLNDNNFLYLNIETNKHFNFPWKLSSDINNLIINFNLTEVLDWYNNLQQTFPYIPTDILNNIEIILNKDELTITDLVKIEKIITPYIRVNWSLSDIQSGYKIVNDIKYNFIDSLKNDIDNKYNKGFNILYRYNNMYIKCDISLKLNKEKITLYNQLYKYYNNDWYRIFKNDFKHNLIIPFFSNTSNKKIQKFKDDLTSLKTIRSSLSQFETLNDIIKYKPLSQEEFDLYIDNFNNIMDIPTNISWDDYELNLKNNLLDISKQFIIKHFNLLSYNGTKRISTFFYIKNNSIQSNIIPLSRSTLLSSSLISFINPNKLEFISDRLNVSSTSLINCIKNISKNYDLSYNKFINIFINYIKRPLDNLYISIYSSKNYKSYSLNGYFTHSDINFLISNNIITKDKVKHKIFIGPINIEENMLPIIYKYLFSNIGVLDFTNTIDLQQISTKNEDLQSSETLEKQSTKNEDLQSSETLEKQSTKDVKLQTDEDLQSSETLEQTSTNKHSHIDEDEDIVEEDYSTFYKENIDKIQTLLKDIRNNNELKNKDRIVGLKYNDNSCYMDSALMFLFSQYNPIISNLFLKINNTDTEEQKIFKYYIKYIIGIIRGYIQQPKDFNVKFLRKLFKNYREKKLYHKTHRHDSAELLNTLFDIIDKKLNMIDLIFFKNPEFKDNDKDIQIINLDRNEGNIFKENYINIPIKLGNKTLQSIILFDKSSKHYTSVIHVNDKWYEYNDLSKIKEINFDKYKQKINTTGIMFMYY